jgi:hypothetical protein
VAQAQEHGRARLRDDGRHLHARMLTIEGRQPLSSDSNHLALEYMP